MESIEAAVERAGQTLRFAYRIRGDLSRLRIPPPAPPGIGTNLWQHTCCEAFVGERGTPSYREFNFSPSGEWAVFAFTAYREGRPIDEDAHVSVRGSGDELLLNAEISVSRKPVTIGLSAVVESSDGALSYWALRHPPGKPDFHHPDAFALELDEIRN